MVYFKFVVHVPILKEESIRIQLVNVRVIDSVDTALCKHDTFYYQAAVKSATLYSVAST